MNVPNTENEMLLLVNQAAFQKQQIAFQVPAQESSLNTATTNTANDTFSQLPVPQTYDNQHFVLQNNCEMDMESLDELLANQGINLEDGEMSVIEQDGRQYLLLPNVSVAQVLETTANVPVEMPQYSTATLPCVQPITTPITSTINSTCISTTTISNGVTVPPVASDIELFSSTASSLACTSTVVNGSLVTTVTSNFADMYRIVPSLRPEASQEQTQIQLRCPLCSCHFDTEFALDEHMKEHRKEPPKDKQLKRIKPVGLRTGKAKKKKSACRLIRTVPYISPSKKGPFLCSVCGLQLPLITVYKRHMKQHMDDKEFKCSHCSESFNIETNLKLHQVLHSNFTDKQEKGYNCPVCPRIFSRVASLMAHLPLHYEDETMICPECGDEFTSKSQLTRHMRQHKMDLQAHIEERSEGPPLYDSDEVFKSNLEMALLNDDSSPRKRQSQKQFYHCMFCTKAFRNKSIFQRHLLIHTGERPFACEICAKTFNQAIMLKQHMFIHTGEKPYSCTYCSQRFTQKQNLRSHIARTHSPSNSFRCQHCSCAFQKLGSLHSHVTRFHSKELEAKNSAEETDKDDDVIQQILSTFEDAPTEEVATDIVEQALQDCGVNNNLQQSQTAAAPSIQVTSNESSMNAIENIQHPHATPVEDTVMMTNHTDSSSIPIPSTGELNRNETRIPETNQNAPVAEVVHTVPQEVTWRVRRVKGVRWHQCMFCPKEFKKPSDLIRHIRTHTNERPYTCKTCNKSFAVKATLAVHERTHLGYKSHKCMVCSKFFTSAGSLKIHHRLHTGAKPFKCTECDKRFRTNGHRNQHMLTHLRTSSKKKLLNSVKKPPLALQNAQTQEQLPDQALLAPVRLDENGVPATQNTQTTNNTVAVDNAAVHVCLTCGKRFKKASHLHEHTRVHTGEKPYACTQCGASFATASILKSHLNVHTGYKPHRCSKCGLSFSSRFSLTRHMASHSQSRPFMCPYCRKLFKTQDACKKHIKFHKKDPKQSITVVRHSVVADSTIDPTALLRIDDVIQDNLNDINKEYATEEPNHVPPDHLVPPATNEVASVPGTAHTNMELHQEVLPFQTNTALDQVNMNVPTALTNFEETIGLNEVAIATSQQQEGNHAAEADIHTQFYQVDQVLNFKCSGCSKYFETKAHLQRHEYELDLKKTAFPCTICHHSLENLPSLTSHIASHNQEMVHRCPICFVGFGDINTARVHKMSHDSAPNSTTLPEEPGSVSALSSFENPLEPFAKPPPIKRKRKRNGFYRLSKEQNEMLQRTSPNQKMCLSEKILLASVAEKGRVSLAQQPGTRGRYKAPDTNGPQYKHSCEYCPKSFRKKCDLTRHIRTHTGDKPYTCITCGKSFRVKSGLTSHEKIHTKVNTFRCHICDTFYSSKTSLKVHMRLHTGTTPYKCPHCSAMFTTPSSRKHHMASHFAQPKRPSPKIRNNSRSYTGNVQSAPTAPAPPPTTATPPTICSSAPPVASIAAPAHTSENNDNPQMAWSDMTFTVPIESLPVMQDSDPVQEQNANVRFDGTNITLQIHPVLLQSLQEGQATLKLNPVTSQGGSWPVQNVILQPVSPVCLQPVANTGVEGSSEPTNLQPLGNKEAPAAVFVSPDGMQTVQSDQSRMASTVISIPTNQTNQYVSMTLNSTDGLTSQTADTLPTPITMHQSDMMVNQSIVQPINHGATISTDTLNLQ